MPLVLVGATVDGKPNFMPAAFLGVVNFKPAVMACGLNPSHYTCQGIEESGCFSINVVPPELVEVTDYCGLKSGKKIDKGALFDLFYGDPAGPPMIQQCRMTAECRLLPERATFAVDTVYFGEVTAVHVDEDALKGDHPVWPAIDPLIFTFPDRGYWRLGSHVAEAWSVGKGFGEKA